MNRDKPLVNSKILSESFIPRKSKGMTVQLDNNKRLYDTAFEALDAELEEFLRSKTAKRIKKIQISKSDKLKENQTAVEPSSDNNKSSLIIDNMSEVKSTELPSRRKYRKAQKSEYQASKKEESLRRKKREDNLTLNKLQRTSIHHSEESYQTKLKVKTECDLGRRPLKCKEAKVNSGNQSNSEQIDVRFEALFAKSIASATRGAKTIRIIHGQRKDVGGFHSKYASAHDSDQLANQNTIVSRSKFKEEFNWMDSHQGGGIANKQLCRDHQVVQPKKKLNKEVSVLKEPRLLEKLPASKCMNVYKSSGISPPEASIDSSCDSESFSTDTNSSLTDAETKNDEEKTALKQNLPFAATSRISGAEQSTSSVGPFKDESQKPPIQRPLKHTPDFGIEPITDIVESFSTDFNGDVKMTATERRYSTEKLVKSHIQKNPTRTSDECLAFLQNEDLSEISDTPLDSYCDRFDKEIDSSVSESRLGSKACRVDPSAELLSASKSHPGFSGGYQYIGTSFESLNNVQGIEFEEQVVPDRSCSVENSSCMKGRDGVDFEFSSQVFQEMFAEFLYTLECLSPIPDSILSDELGPVAIQNNADEAWIDANKSQEEACRAELDVNQPHWNIPSTQRMGYDPLKRKMMFPNSKFCSPAKSCLGSVTESGSLKLTLKRARNDQWSVISSEDARSVERLSQFGGSIDLSTETSCKIIENASTSKGPIRNAVKTKNYKQKLPLDSQNACKITAVNKVFMRRVLKNNGLIKLQT